MLSGFFPKKKRSQCNASLIKSEERKQKHVPDVIRIQDISVYDIERIYDFSLNYFYNKELDIDDLSDKLNKLKESVNLPQTYVEKKNILDEISRIEYTISSISENKKNYMREIKPLINEFNEFYNSMNKKKFGEDNKTSDDIISRVLSIVEILKKYTDMNFDIVLLSKFSCSDCGFDLSDASQDDEIVVCPGCREENVFNKNQCKIPSVVKNNSSQQSDYSERANFLRFLIRFQGQQNVILDDDLYEKLDHHFVKDKTKNNTRKVVSTRKTDFKGFKEGTTLVLMLSALKECGFSHHYNDVYFICKEYWGWILADLKKDEEKIMYIYDITQLAYAKIPNKKRSSSISIPFKAFKILELCGYPYEVIDFKIPKDDKSKEETESYWKMSCEKCEDPSVMYIPTRKY